MENKIILPERELPRQWYNALPDLPTPLAPPLDPQTHQPVSPEQLEVIFPKAVIEQELSPKRWLDIPEPVLDIYRLFRPTPLVRARRLEEALGVKCKIYYKNESVSPAGSHKPNTAVAQAYYNKQEGVRRIATETGAGQWGTALAFSCAMPAQAETLTIAAGAGYKKLVTELAKVYETETGNKPELIFGNMERSLQSLAALA